jgi:hypothetical protein
MPYSFTEPIVIQLLQMSHQLVPGLLKVIGLRWDGIENSLAANIIEYPREGAPCDVLEIPASSIASLQKLRQEHKSFTWFHLKELPFETAVHQEKQLDVFQEMERNVLMVPLTNERDGLSDLLFFYFADNFSTFKLSNANKNLFPEHRIIIGTMLQHSLRTFYQINLTDREVLRQVNGSTRSIIERYRESQEEMKRLTSGVQRNILDISRHLLDEISPGGGTQYILTTAAAEKLKKFKGEIPELKTILKNAVTFASALDFGFHREEIRLDEYHIDLELNRHQPRSSDTAEMPSVALLDKLEDAAKKVHAKDLPLTGANVGSACVKAISAPAVTDALKKHKSKILTLLKEYPDRWNLLRSEFKPLINILTAKKSDNTQEAKHAG